MNGKQLKNSILQWAIRGRLVPQDPTDEPASVLLQRIRAEKARLVREGKLKKSAITDSVIFRDQDNKYYERNGKTLTCIDEEIPFEIPETWEWVRLPQIAISELGKTLDKAKNRGRLKPYLCSINIQWSGIDLSCVKQTKFEDAELDRYLLQKGDLLICEGGDVGRSAVWESNDFMCYQNALHRVRFYSKISPYYFKSVMEAYKAMELLDKEAKGMTIKHLVQSSLNALLLPLPPLPEQHRIVSKVEALMSVVERYEKAQDEIDALCNSLNGRLRKSILQEAIRGRLVPQDPTDEPASALLQRIRAEKARLVREGKLKKSAIDDSTIFRGQDNKYYERNGKTLTCIDEEIPFEIPETWKWVRLKHICFMQAGKNISASKIYDEKSEANPYRCVGGNGLRGYTSTFNAEGEFAIVGRQGALCGCLNMEVGKFYATEHAVVVNSFGIIPSRFIFYFFTALNLNQYATATAQPGLAVSNINEVFLPLPPLPEQHRIVSKIEELFGVLGRLANR